MTFTALLRFLGNAASGGRAKRGRARRGPGSARARLGFEGLEDRRLLAASLVKDLNPGVGDSAPALMAELSGEVFFQADDGTHGLELWKSDGAGPGSVLVKNIHPGSTVVGSTTVPLGSNPRYLTTVGGNIFFAADDGTSGVELWKTDGTAAGTVLVKDIQPGSGGSNPANLTNVNGTLFFTAGDGTSGVELWKSDGTAAGTVLVENIGAGSAGSNPAGLVNVGGTLFFSADDGANGVELWKSDGSLFGTAIVTNVRLGPGGSNPVNLTNVNGTLFFGADDGINGVELWKSDGSVEGTTLVKNIATGSVGSNPANLTSAGGTLFFTADDGTHGPELWTSTGTGAGTVLAKDINTQAGVGSYPANLTNVGGTLFFRADDGTAGNELWQSDGTAAGTVLVKDIKTGALGSTPANLASANGVLFFTADDGTSGAELWQSDGTAAGTVLVTDIRPGAEGSHPAGMTKVGATLFLSANNGTQGVELWKAPLPNQKPLSNNDNYVFDTNTTLTVPLAGVLANDTDPDGDPLVSAVLVAGPAHGTLTLNANGSFTYVPDTGFNGRDRFTYKASDGTSPSAVAGTATLSSRQFQWVERLYEQILGRTAGSASEGEVLYWVGALGTGLGRSDVAAAFASSAEYRTNLVTGYYRQYLGREPEAGALSGWLAQMTGGLSAAGVLGNILGSTEYYLRGISDASLVSRLYSDLLGRTPANAEAGFWKAALVGGATRIDVASGILASAEYGTLVINSLYGRYLHRVADTGGLAFWLGQLEAGRTWQDVEIGLAASAEYFAS